MMLSWGISALPWVLLLVLVLLWPRKAKVTVFVRPWKPLPAEQIARAFKEWPADDPRWRALWDWLGEEYEATMLELHRLPDTPEAMLVWKGRAQMLMHLRAQQIAWRKGNGDN